MPKDEAEKAARKAEKAKKRAEAATSAANANGGSMSDVEMAMGDVSMVDGEGKGSKKAKVVVSVEELSPIAKPLAGDKLNKKIHKTIKRASRLRLVKRGVKEVVKSIKKGEKGFLILAGDITPMDIISHLPVLAEEASIPYIFVASKEELGHASATKRPTSCVLVCPESKVKRKKKEGEDTKEEEKEFKAAYDECLPKIKELNETFVY